MIINELTGHTSHSDEKMTDGYTRERKINCVNLNN